MDTRPPDVDERQQPSRPEAFETNPQPSSPTASQGAEELDDCAIPPFQLTKELSVSVDSRGNDFESPNAEATMPYQPHVGRVSMRATNWTYY